MVAARTYVIGFFAAIALIVTVVPVGLQTAASQALGLATVGVVLVKSLRWVGSYARERATSDSAE